MDTNARVRADGARYALAPSALTLLESAHQKLAAGERDSSAASRYASARLAALRAAAAVVAAKPDAGILERRKRPRNIWELLPRAEPAFTGWAAHFAAVARAYRPARWRRVRAVSHRQADRMLCDAQAFVSLAEDTLGVTGQPSQHGVQHHPSAAHTHP